MHTRSADGTTIAYEVTGDGAPLVLVGGAFCDRSARSAGTPLAALLADRFTVISYDRRGRGGSGDTPPYTIDREIEDLAAVIETAGGSAFVFGISSGGLLAVDAAAQGIAIPKLAIYEPPVILDPSRARMFETLAAECDDACASNRRADAVALFLTKVVQVPAPAVQHMRTTPAWAGLEALAHTLAYDLRITARGASRLEQMSAVRSTTVVIDGASSPPWMRDAIEVLSRALPDARRRTLEAQTHDVDPHVLARSLVETFDP